MAEVINRGPEKDVKANATVIAKFEETKEDGKGNLIASGREPERLHEGMKAGATVVEEFDSVEEDANGNLIVHRKPDFAK